MEGHLIKHDILFCVSDFGNEGVKFLLLLFDDNVVMEEGVVSKNVFLNRRHNS